MEWNVSCTVPKILFGAFEKHELLQSDEIFYGIIYSDGHIHLQDVSKECIKDKWIPLATYAKNGQPTVILFKTQELAKKFSKRNFPAHWVKGAVQLTKENILFLIQKDLNLEVFDFPKKLKEMNFEVLEFQDQPDLHYRRSHELKNI